MSAAEVLELATPHGPARAHLIPGSGAGTLLLGHGAGGGVHAPDLAAAAQAARAIGFTVVLIEQPYRVRGRRSPAPASQLDSAWVACADGLRGRLGEGPLVTGGRSSGARVACRTAARARAQGVLCLAFPLVPPGQRRDGTAPPSRLPELDGVPLPALVIQGEGDRFGMPPPAPGRQVVTVRGDHSLRSDLEAVSAAVERWLRELRTPGPAGAQSGRRESNPP